MKNIVTSKYRDHTLMRCNHNQNGYEHLHHDTDSSYCANLFLRNKSVNQKKKKENIEMKWNEKKRNWNSLAVDASTLHQPRVATMFRARKKNMFDWRHLYTAAARWEIAAGIIVTLRYYRTWVLLPYNKHWEDGCYCFFFVGHSLALFTVYIYNICSFILFALLYRFAVQ